MGTLRTVRELDDNYLVQVWDDQTGKELASWAFAKHIAIQMKSQFLDAVEYDQVAEHLEKLSANPSRGMIARIRRVFKSVNESRNPFWRFW